MLKIFNKSRPEFLIVGLGNPGDKYKNTRHNAGFMAIDQIIAEKGVTVKKVKHHAEVFETSFADNRVLMAKPQTFMNLSGDAVEEIINYHKIPVKNVIVLADDISLPPGKLRIRRKGSAGGHNGLKDIILKTGCDTFPRIKIGVGAKPPKWDLSNWVLSEFSGAEREKIDIAIKNVSLALELMIGGDIDGAMSKFNS